MRGKGPIRNILEYFNLENDLEEVDKIHDTILKDTEFKGTNLWILMFAIVVASVGLNMNSPAVIIGAMLISPLMGPINGMGYSIATYNMTLFKRAVKNFSFAVLVSLTASTAYFALSPISTAHSELLARTSPSIYDVLIALFGGLAGIIALSTKQKGNVIPGVAIATALMPPLCTAGYGLATGQFQFFFGAFYLFTINTVFIALSSVVVSQLLNFPIRTDIEEKQKRRINQWISVIILLILFPSIYFGYRLVQKEKFLENSKSYVNSVSVYDGNYLLHHEIDPDNKHIKLIYGGANLSSKQKEAIKNQSKNFHIDHPSIEIEQGLSFNSKSGIAELDKLKGEVGMLNSDLKSKEAELLHYKKIPETGKTLLEELKTFYPTITNCSYSETYIYGDSTSVKTNLILLKSSEFIGVEERKKINNWLRKRLNDHHVSTIFQENY